jgi:hypothetical protein
MVSPELFEIGKIAAGVGFGYASVHGFRLINRLDANLDRQFALRRQKKLRAESRQLKRRLY